MLDTFRRITHIILNPIDDNIPNCAYIEIDDVVFDVDFLVQRRKQLIKLHHGNVQQLVAFKQDKQISVFFAKVENHIKAIRKRRLIKRKYCFFIVTQNRINI